VRQRAARKAELLAELGDAVGIHPAVLSDRVVAVHWIGAQFPPELADHGRRDRVSQACLHLVVGQPGHRLDHGFGRCPPGGFRVGKAQRPPHASNALRVPAGLFGDVGVVPLGVVAEQRFCLRDSRVRRLGRGVLALALRRLLRRGVFEAVELPGLDQVGLDLTDLVH